MMNTDGGNELMSFVSHQSPNGLEYFIKADQAEGLTVIVAGDSVVK